MLSCCPAERRLVSLFQEMVPGKNAPFSGVRGCSQASPKSPQSPRARLDTDWAETRPNSITGLRDHRSRVRVLLPLPDPFHPCFERPWAIAGIPMRTSPGQDIAAREQIRLARGERARGKGGVSDERSVLPHRKGGRHLHGWTLRVYDHRRNRNVGASVPLAGAVTSAYPHHAETSAMPYVRCFRFSTERATPACWRGTHTEKPPPTPATSPTVG